MRNILAIIAGLIAIISTVPYIRDILRGKTHPNIVTWFTWFLLNTITAIASFSGHSIQTGIFAGGAAVCTGLVVVAGARGGLKKYSAFDYICQALALIGVVLWRLTGEPAVSITINVAADCVGVLPTYRHSWRAPQEETWQSYAIGGISAVIAIASISHFNYLSLIYPIYILVSDISLVGTILYRLRSMSLR